MTDKVEVVYIGPKPVKRLAVLGKKYIFPRLKPVAINDEAAYHLLDFPTVFSTPEEAEAKTKEQEELETAAEKAKLAAEAEEKAKVVEQSFAVIIDGEIVDISKHTVAKMRTVIAAEDLDIVTENVQAAELRKKLRDALHAKHGNPEA